MAATFRFRVGTLDLSSYVRVNPDDKLDPQGAPWIEPAFTETPFADGQPLISTTVQNREQQIPIFAKAGAGAAVTNQVTDPSFEYDAVGGAPAGWSTTGPAALVNAGATATVVAASALGPSSSRLIGSVSGQQAMQVTTTNALSLEGASISLGILPAGTYTASMFVKGNADGQAVTLFAGPNGAGGGSVNFTANSGDGPVGWVRQSVTFTADGAAIQYVGIRTQGATAVTVFVDAVAVTSGATLQGYGDGDSAGFLWDGAPGNSTSTSLVGKDGLHQLIRAIQNACNQRPLTVEWRDDSATQSTFYDVQFARFEPDFNFRRSVHNYAAGTLHIWTTGYGHTGTTRVTATAAGTGIFLSVPIGSVAGDAPALLDTRIVAGAVLPSLGRIVALAPIIQPSYTPQIPAASLTDRQTNATLVGASGADGSQYLALPVSPTGGASGVACRVPLPNPTIAGGDNRILAVVKSGISAGVGLYALDPFGNSMGATAIASMSQGWGLVDLGVCRLPTVGFPTLPKISIYAGGVWASGAQGPVILSSPAALAINEVFCLPDKNLTLLYERSAGSILSKDAFARTAYVNGQNDDVGNPWSAAWNNLSVPSPGQLIEVLGGDGGGALRVANIGSTLDSSHLAGILSDGLLISCKPAFPALASGGDVRLVKESASGAYLQARLINKVATFSLDLAAATNTTLNTLASLALATLSLGQSYRLALQCQGPGAFVNLSRDDGGPVFIPGSAAYASVGVASSAAAAAAGIPAVAVSRYGNEAGAAGLQSYLTVQSWEVDTVPSQTLLAYDAYRLDGPNADSYRTSSAGAFAGQKLVSVQRGAFPKLQPSTTSVAVLCAPVDQGAANDLISAAVSIRERFTYSR